MARERNVHPPPRHISQKVPKRGGPSPEYAIRRALDLADDLVGDYQGWAVDDLEKLWQQFRASTKAPPAKRDIQRMFDMAHEIRGQGGSFGFPLISVLADSLCKFLEGRGRLRERDIDVVKIHILAMKAVFRQGLRGAQAPLSQDLGILLPELRNRVDDGG